MKKFVVAYPDDVFALETCKRLKKKSKKFEFNPIERIVFRDNEVKIRIKNNIRKSECFFIHNSNLNPSQWFLELALVNEALYNSSAAEITNVLPYLRFSRQDRKDKSRVAVNAKVVANVINSYANRVLTLDVHSPQIALAYNVPFDNLYSFPIVIRYLMKNYSQSLENLVLMGPDVGGAKRVEAFKNRLERDGIKTDIAIGYKYRPKEGEVAEFRMIGDVAEKNVLIVDDIIDSGKTLIEAAKELKKKGAKKIFAYATHGLFTEGIDKVTENFEKIFVGNTLALPRSKKIEVISFANLFAEAIYRISQGKSLSELFED